ncbi:hypothetical protein GQR58_030366 [Nymphon striatum]|nr:hypothetical protein GQR58_030366 [Nymphon striatum]
MGKRVFHSLQALVVLTAPALACYPDPEFSYDDLKALKRKRVGVFTYLDVQYLYGFGEKEFSVKTCSDEVYQVEALSEELESLEYLGFVPEAEVLIGLVSPDQNNSEVRYAIPSCWGPLHFNLDKMSSEEQWPDRPQPATAIRSSGSPHVSDENRLKADR